MKAKVISISVFLILAYVIPLIGKIELLWTMQVLILAIFASLLFITQPPLQLTEAKQDKRNDKLSVLFILLACLVSQVAAIIEWAYFNESVQWKWDWQTYLGLGLLIGGTSFRVWSIRTLGKFFTATVKTQRDQRIVKVGAYKYLRHPSYTGAFLAVVGNAVFLHAPVATIISFVAMFAAYWWRIKVEEATLVEEFGAEYSDYQLQTKKLIPFVY